MATVFDQVDIDGLRITHFNQLLTYIQDAESQGWYYGIKKSFVTRHNELKEWVEGILSYACSEGVIIPKRKERI